LALREGKDRKKEKTGKIACRGGRKNPRGQKPRRAVCFSGKRLCCTERPFVPRFSTQSAPKNGIEKRKKERGKDPGTWKKVFVRVTKTGNGSRKRRPKVLRGTALHREPPQRPIKQGDSEWGRGGAERV